MRTWFKRLLRSQTNRQFEPAPFSLRWEQLEDRLSPAFYAVSADLQVQPLAPVTMPLAAQVVFIESSVPQAAMLLHGLAQHTDGVLLDAHGDGLREMAAILGNRRGLEAIDVVAHGQSGAVNLGTRTVDDATLPADSADLTEIAPPQPCRQRRRCHSRSGRLRKRQCRRTLGSQATPLRSIYF
jgi:hypothetical protein